MTADEAELIGKVGASGEVAAVLPLMWPLMESSENGKAAANAIAQLLAAASSGELLELEEEVRGRSSWDLPIGWSRLTVQNLVHLRSKFDSPLAGLGLLSWHPNGRIREYACREMSLLQESSVQAYLFPRMNDWVEPIRRIARESLQNRIDDGRCSDLFGNLHLVFRLLDCQREDHRRFVMLVMNELTASHQQTAFTAALDSPSKLVRRTCYRLGMEIDGDHRQAAVRHCLQCKDPVLRLSAARDARAMLASAELEVAVQTMRGDPLMPMRREALLTVMEQFPDQAIAELTEALLDPNASLCEFARFYLRKLEAPASPDLYREALAAGRHVAIAIAGIGETGSPNDAEMLLPFLADPSAKRRGAATRSIGALAGACNAKPLLGMLQDSSKKVSDKALRTLRSNTASLDLSELWNVFQSPHRHVRRAVLELMGEFSIWSTMPYLIEAATHADSETAENAQRIVLRCCNRVFTKPSIEQRHAIDEQLCDAEPRCPEFVAECRLFLGTR